MLTINNISKQYKHQEWSLKNIQLSAGNGVYGLIGPNGAGKTTLMEIVTGGLKPTIGDVTLNQMTLRHAPEAIRAQIGYLPQAYQINGQFTGESFIDYAAVMKGIKGKKERQLTIDRCLSSVNLLSKRKEKVKTYSTGMKQRLGIAQALIGKPKLLILDEPTVGLDPIERIRFRNLIAQIGMNSIVVLSTHIVGDIVECCESLALLHEGKIAFLGSAEGLAKQAEGKVWETILTDNQRIIHSKNLTILKRQHHNIHCKLISEHQPTEQAVLLRPTVIDGYLAIVGGR